MTTPCPCGEDGCTKGRPRPEDVCQNPNNPALGCIHGHWFDDGQCTYCGRIDDGRMRERFDHWDVCSFWRGGVCDCEWKR